METTRTQHEKEKTMTLYKQLSLIFLLIIAIILASVLYINYDNAKTQMIESTYQNSVNNISVLSEKLATADGDETVISSIVDAEFSSGYYQKISYISYGSKFSYTQEFKKEIEGVPAWFVQLVNLKLQSVSTDVTNGWSILGKVEVLGDSSVIYQALYKIFIHLLLLFVVFVIVSLVILAVLLHFVLRPLKKIQHQAEAIKHNEFILIDKPPFTTELRDVSSAMNAMVQKVEKNFQQANAISQKNHELLYIDSVTKLYNRRYFMLKLPELIQTESKINGGTLFMIGLTGAQTLNQKLGYQKADTFLHNLAQVFSEQSKEFDEKIIARLNGTEFAMMLTQCSSEHAKQIATAIYEAFLQLLSSNELSVDEVDIFLGLYRYHANIEVSSLLQNADLSLMQAKAAEESHIFLQTQQLQNTPSKEEWRTILHTALQEDNFALKFYNCIDTTAKTLQHKVMTFTIEMQERTYFYGDFIAVAIELGLAAEIYANILEKLFTTALQTKEKQKVSLRLSNDFLKSPSTFAFLEKLLKQHEKSTHKKLIFEMSNAFCTTYTTLANDYVELFKSFDYEICINSFTNESSDLSYLKKLSPSIIKADVTFLLDLSSDALNSLVLITNSLNITLTATAVREYKELEKLQNYGISTIQGPLTEEL